MPGILRKARRFDARDVVRRQPEHLGNIQTHMLRCIRRKIFSGQGKEPHRRAHAPSVGRVPGTNALFLQMDECTRKLDESLEEGMIFVLALQPQVLEHIMRFIVLLGVEADEVSQIARIKSLRREIERFHIGFDPLGLVHWLRGHPQTIEPNPSSFYCFSSSFFTRS